MLFNSFEFLIFFPVVSILFFLLPQRLRIYQLLIASCIFYCYFIPYYLLLLLFTILVDYFAAFKIERSVSHRKSWLIVSICANLGLLFIFKYYNFFISNINGQIGTSWTLLHIILPVGLSFHTFQAMAYTTEVYRGTVKPERNIFVYSLYVLFYPQLVAGPIERPQHLLPQLNKKQAFSVQQLTDGLRLMLWGFFKKLVIADAISNCVAIVYRSPESYSWHIVVTAIFFFSIQIYCDFSGYTDIARGAAKVMGYDLMINFNRPLLSQSITEFWRRWHVSLSTWFRDYVYIPLGGNRKGIPMQYFFLLIVFALSGFWHGAGFNYIVWGLCHAIFVITATHFFSNRSSLKNNFKIFKIIGVNLLVAYALIFFRNDTLGKAWMIIKASVNFKTIPGVATSVPGIGSYSLGILFFFIAFMFFFESVQDPDLKKMSKYSFWDIAWFTVITFSILFFGVFSKESFIYFQF